MAGFNTAITGIKAASTMLDVAGNNIANSSTTGFKSSRTEFADIYTKAVVGSGSSNTPGSGVTVADISQDFSSGTLEYTNNNLDLAIAGAGFFLLDDGQGDITYTRAGAFELNRDGYVVSKNGKFVKGFGLDALGTQTPLQNLRVDEKESPPKATEFIDMSFNIDTAADAQSLTREFNKLDSASYSYSMTVGTYDSLGNENDVRFYFVEQAAYRETYQFSGADASTGNNAASIAAGVISYDPTVTMRLSGLTLSNSGAADTLNLDPATATATTAGLDAISKARLANVDPRIDPDSVYYNFTNNTLNFEFTAEYTQQGDPYVEVNGLPGANLVMGQNFERTANEIQTVPISMAAFTAGPSMDQLGTATQIEIADTVIDLPATATLSDVGEIIEANEARIMNNNPSIENVRFISDGTNFNVEITWKAEVGEVPNMVEAREIVGTGSLFIDADADGLADTNRVQKGDNSFIGSYRMYAYLNDQEQLDIGKMTDPGSTSVPTTEMGSIMVNFNSTTGALDAINGEAMKPNGTAPKITIMGADKTNPTDAILPSDIDSLPGIQLDLSGSSQFASSSMIKSLDSDGQTKGDLVGVSFVETGEMVASYSNGAKKNLGIVALATFENQDGLNPTGNTEWRSSVESGMAIVNAPMVGLNGSLEYAALEQSNVDLSSELVKLIEGQRNYQANSKTLETMNTITQTILNI